MIITQYYKEGNTQYCKVSYLSSVPKCKTYPGRVDKEFRKHLDGEGWDLCSHTKVPVRVGETFNWSDHDYTPTYEYMVEATYRRT